MGRKLVFGPRPPEPPDDSADESAPTSLPDKLQVLMLTRPFAAREIERLIDRLLADK